MTIDGFLLEGEESMTHFKKPSVQNVHVQVLILAGIEFQVARKSACVDHLPSLRMQEKRFFRSDEHGCASS